MDGGSGTDETDYQRSMPVKEAASILHIKIPMANRKPVKFRCVSALS